MPDILTDLSPTALAFAARANLCEFFAGMGRSPAVEFHAADGLTRWRTAVPHPWFNGVLCTRPPADGEADVVQEVLAHFQSNQVPAFTWWLHPNLSTADWAPHLQAHGFRLDSSTPGMGIALSQLNSSAPPPGLRISVVEDLEALRLWTDTFAAGYGLPAEWATPYYQLMAGMGLDLPMRSYLGYLDDRAVAASTLFLGAGVAGIYSVATLPEARGRGIGAALTLAPLQEAERMGYQAGILQSSDMGFSVYRRLGFSKVCDVEHFFWKGG